MAAALLIAACRTSPEPPGPPPALAERPAGENWRAVARPEDLDRLARLDAAWTEGLAEARAFATRIRAEGRLLEPGAALPRAALPPGSYRCRLLRLGGRVGLTVYPPYFCHVGVEGALLSFTKQTGTERPGGYLWTDGDRRMVFLGALAPPGQSAPRAYGEDPASDVAGIVERVGDFNYRLVIPWPRAGAKIDVLDLVPVVRPE